MDSDENALCYELVSVAQLPAVDIKTSIKSVLFRNNTNGLKKLNALKKATKVLNVILYACAFPVGAAALVVDQQYASYMAVLKSLLQLPLLLFAVSSLRLALLRCLVATYDFWFFSFLNTANCVIFCLHLADLRMAMVPVYWIGIQMNICADARVQARQLAGLSVLAILYHVFVLLVLGFQLTPGATWFRVFSYNKRAMSSEDFLMNSFATMLVLLVRTAYRKREFLKAAKTKFPVMIRCVSYRTRVKFRACKGPRHPRRRVGNGEHLFHQLRVVHALQKPSLRLVKLGIGFKYTEIVWPRALSIFRSRRGGTRRRPWQVLVWKALGVLGYVLMVSDFVRINYYALYRLDGDFIATGVSGLALALVCMCASTGCCHQELLANLVFSFDFAFLSAQLTLAHICLCDIVLWGDRCLPVLSHWIWMHWVLMLDACTPKMKQNLGVRIRHAAPIVGVCIIAQLVTCVQLLLDANNLHDRVLWTTSLLNREIKFRLVPFLLNRIFALFLLSLRLLWKVVTNGEDGLIIIQGCVEFAGNPKALNQPDAGPARESVHPLTAAISTRLSAKVKPEAAR